MAEADQPSPPQNLELQEYKLTENVEKKLLARAKFIFAVFLAGLTLLGVFGYPLLLEHLSRKVAGDIQKEMAKETDNLNRRLIDSLAELNISAAEIKQIAEKSKGRLALLATDYKNLEELNARYVKLQADVVKISNSFSTTTAAVKAAQANTNALRTALADSAEGKSTIIQVTYNYDEKNERLIGLIISGANLGSRPGKIKILPYYGSSNHWADYVRSEPLEIDVQSVKAWKPERIELAFTTALQEKLNLIWGKMVKKLGVGEAFSRRVEFEIQTANGTPVSGFLYTAILQQAKLVE